MEAPPMSNHNARHYLRAYARTMEGLGDDEGAVEWYGKFIRFGSQASTNVQCIGCHQGSEGPRNMAWFRGWWAGNRFARYTDRTGHSDQRIVELETAIRQNSNDSAARMMLAYLYEAKGQTGSAEKMWAKLGVPRIQPGQVALSTAATR
jgi:hypothetical protein